VLNSVAKDTADYKVKGSTKLWFAQRDCVYCNS